MLDDGLFLTLAFREGDIIVHCVKSILQILDLNDLHCTGVFECLGFVVIDRGR